MSKELHDFAQKPGSNPNRLRVLLAFHRWLEDLGYKNEEKEEEKKHDNN